MGASEAALPGAVDAEAMALPVGGDDDDMQDGGQSSPKKPRKHASAITVDLETLKGLLADQAAQINETQRACLSQAVTGLRADFEAHRDELKRDLHGTSLRVTAVEEKMSAMQDRLAKLERGDRPAAGSAGTMDDRHKFTLVYGGWPKDSARKDILQSLEQTFDRLELTSLLDTKAFTTGPRRSMALQTFLVRPDETFVSMRNRMSVVIAAIANTTIFLGPGDSNKLWASYSKPKEARLNGGHSAWVRRLVRAVDSTQEQFLEAEYSTGSCWLHGKRVCAAIDKMPDEGVKGDFIVDDTKPQKPWIAAKLIADLLKVTKGEVNRAAANTKR